MTALLEARAVTKYFGGGMRGHRMTAVDDFSLAISNDPPSIVALVGESGSGKTTLARLLLGLVDPSEGAVLYKGADIRSLPSAEKRAFRRDVQVIFQDPFEAYNPFYRVDHVLTTPLLNFGLARSRAEARRMIEETLRAVGLRPEETLGRFPHQLSGGQRQRIMVARALLIRPRVIIADEPVSMVDASLRAIILASLRKLHDEFGISLIYITHDLTTAYQICQNVIVLYRGSIAEAGDSEQVVRDPAHPYTRLLIGSIPNPDPDQPWKGEEAASAEGLAASEQGCRFATRCPSAMEMCRDNRPPMFRTDPHRAAACYLYRDGEAVAGADLGSVLVQGDVETAARPLALADAPIMPRV
jgi:oligopeptide/dipeptide ABC transporter ATP-binding protein